jgi:coproporphyrinogen III oxidase
LNSGKYWFGGGIDLTPHYVDKDASGLFHLGLKQKCDAFHPNFYQKFKPWADEYFSLPHRNETRGIGGIFFDHQDESCGITKDQLFQYCVELGELFPILYKQQIDFNSVSLKIGSGDISGNFKISTVDGIGEFDLNIKNV